jgi:preprotein translocase subunit SecG
METIFLTIHTIVAVALVATILLQRSEGGALGIGGGSGGLMSARGAGDVLTKTTKWLAIVFLANALFLGWLAANKTDDLDDVAADVPIEQPVKDGGDTLPEPQGLPEPGEG